MTMQPRILYVEDHLESREVMEIILTTVMGIHKTVIFQDSANFITRIEQLPWVPDLFLLDIHMKPHTGFEMLRMLRSHPTFASKPVIALTASVMSEEVQLLKSSGFDGVVAKPVDVETFPSILNRILSGEQIWLIS
jgi:CheY-like chemotaxis protein